MIRCVFVGPTLAVSQAKAHLDAVYLPPARQGDVYRVSSRLDVHSIGLVDGYFHQVPSVWHKEILWAMAKGIQVYGSASMGALRAAELAPFGMHGVGRIFEAYRDGVLEPYVDEVFEDDDEVAVLHGPPAAGFASVSEAMVNIRVTLARAARADVIDAQTRDWLVQRAKASFYPERTWDRLLGEAVDRLAAGEIERLRDWLIRGRVDQKRADALEMVRELAGTPRHTAPPQFEFQHTRMWDRLVAQE